MIFPGPSLSPLAAGRRRASHPVAGYSLWLRADAGVLTAAGGAAADGDAVATWRDQSGNGFDLTDAAGGAAYAAGAVNGKPALAFDGSTTGLLGPGFSLGDFTIFAVYQATGHGFGDFERIVDLKFSTGTWLGRYINVADRWGGGVMEAADPFGAYATLADGTWHLLASKREGTTHAVYGDGSLASSSTVSAGATAPYPLRVGCSAPADNYNRFLGRIAELLVYPAALSDADRAAVEGYLNRKYAIY